MKKTILIISMMIAFCSVFARDNADAKKLIEDSRQKLSLKNIHLVLDLETFDGKGNSKSKSMAASFAEFDQQKKVMLEFTAPESMKGTRILTTDYSDKKGIIEIYMPSTGKIQKIRANQRSMKIMGSEIPISQFSSVIDNDYSFSLLGEELLNGINCYKIKGQAQGTKRYEIAYVSVKDEHLLQIEEYDMRDNMLSMTELSDYVEINNATYKVFPRDIKVKNMKNGKSSEMKVRQIEYLSKMNAKDFELTASASK